MPDHVTSVGSSIGVHSYSPIELCHVDIKDICAHALKSRVLPREASWGRGEWDPIGFAFNVKHSRILLFLPDVSNGLLRLFDYNSPAPDDSAIVVVHYCGPQLGFGVLYVMSRLPIDCPYEAFDLTVRASWFHEVGVDRSSSGVQL